MHIKIGTRGSKLALWQAYHIEHLLNIQKVTSEIVIIDTKGDKILDVSLSKIGGKGIFTEELEDRIRSGSIDIAVHSAKDVQSQLADDLELIAFSEREEINDVVVSFNPTFNLEDSSKKIVVGTSSTRRVAMLKHFYPHIEVVDMRGNLQTRFEKLKRGDCDAMILAYAGVHRMNYDKFIVKKLPVDQFIPPAGQGSVAIECSKRMLNEMKESLRNAVNHPETEVCLVAERAFLKRMNGGCSVPTYSFCSFVNHKEIIVKGGIISMDGANMIVKQITRHPSEAKEAGIKLAEDVLSSGGDIILTAIKNQTKN